jgi:RNA polymerase sigma-70 factor (ECF subfamily)
MKTQSEHQLKNLIKLLPEEQREVLIMRHWGDMSFKEIAEKTDVSINTALGRMRYALNNLRKLMVDKGVQI